MSFDISRTAAVVLVLSLLAPFSILAQEGDEAAVGDHLDRGASLLYQGKYDEAIAEFEKALALKPTYLKARLNLATAYFYKKDYPRAEREYLRCLKLDPSYVNARFNLAIAYQAQEKFDEAMAVYRKVLETDPDNAVVFRNMGRIHEAREDLMDAAEAYEKSLTLDPKQKNAADLRRKTEELRFQVAERKAAEEPAEGAPPQVASAEPAEPIGAVEPPQPAEPRAPAPPAPAPETMTAVSPAEKKVEAETEAETRVEASTSIQAESPVPPEPGEAEALAEDGVEAEAAAALPPTPTPEDADETTVTASSPPSDPEVLHRLLVSLAETRGEGKTLLTSTPLGAEVYIRHEDYHDKDPFHQYGPFGAHKRSRSYLELRSDIVDKKNFRGYTPFVIDLTEGHYQIAFRIPGRQDDYVEDGNVAVQSSSLAIRRDDLASDVKIYEVSVSPFTAPAVVSTLFQRKGETASAFATTCGDGPFEFDRDQLMSMLRVYQVPDEEADAALRLLSCGAKAVIPMETGNVTIALNEAGHPEVLRNRR